MTGHTGVPFFAPMVNSDYLGNPLRRGFAKSSSGIPVMIGSTFGEFSAHPLPTDGSSDEDILSALTERFGAHAAEKVLSLFHAAYPDEPAWQIFHVDTDAFRPHCKKIAMSRAEDGCAPTYLYLFTPTFHLNKGTKAWHCSDIPYFFRNVLCIPSENLGEAGQKLENAMAGGFANFARSGSPGHPELPDWPPCEKGDELTMVLDLHSRVVKDFDSDLLKILQPMHLSSKIVNILIK